MTKCKFCKNQSIISIKKYGYNKFSVCKDDFHKGMAVGIKEFFNLTESDLEEKE